MPSGAKKSNARYAPRLRYQALKTVKELLVFVGKPLFVFLVHGLIGFFFLAYVVGHAVRIFLKIEISKYQKLSILKLELFLERIFQSFKAIRVVEFPKGMRVRFWFFVSLLFVASLVSFWVIILRDLPTPDKLLTREQEISTKIYDRDGVLLYKIFKNQNRTPVSLNKIPLHVRQATLAAEDAEFYSHPGFSLKGMFRALIRNIKRGELSGGSTITQQLVKNALLSPEKTLIRKIKEIILAISVETHFTKDEILKMYLNEVAYGGVAYGIQEAASLYFGKDVSALSLAEAAYLAGLPRSPTKYSPYGSNPEDAISRQKEVLKLMEVNRYVSQAERENAEGERLVFLPKKTDIKAPHFVMLVKEKLVEEFGEETVAKGGLEVITTLDYKVQRLAEEVVATELSKLARLNVGNGAAVVLDTRTGEILAMVGSKDYFDIKNDGNVNVVVRPRQPGSSIKVVNYAYALSHGYTPGTILDDSPVTYNIPGQPPYSPKNYDGVFRGKIPLRSAFAESRNVPAVKVLASYGVDKMLTLGQQMGVTSWNDKSRFGLSLTLGGGEVTLLDLARVYSTVANYGKRPEIVMIKKVTDYKGRQIKESSFSASQILDPRVAYLLIDILKDNFARSPAFGLHSSLVIPGHPEVAVKTGTSNNLKDNLTVGFNQKYLVAVWVGNNSSAPMARIASGITGAAPIWNKIMTGILAKEPVSEWIAPDGLSKIAICPYSGTLPCGGCPTRLEWFLKESTPTFACKPEFFENPKVVEGSILEPAAHYP